MERLEIYKKNIKKIKSRAVVAVECFGVAALGCAVGGYVWQENLVKDRKEVISNSNYEQYNTDYRIEQLESLAKAYENGELSPSEFLKKTEEIEDYDKNTYVKNAQEVSVKDKEKYFNQDKYKKAEGLIGGGFVGMLVGDVGAIGYALVALKKESKKYDAIYPEEEKTKQ